MTVKQLKEQLNKMSDDTIILHSVEGNVYELSGLTYNPFEGVVLY